MNISEHNIIFVFDLDNTLVKTNKANNESYKAAIRIVTGMDCDFKPQKRFTRSDLKNCFPILSEDYYSAIVVEKENLFGNFIDKTRLNRSLYAILKALHDNGNKTILLTNSHKKRAMQLCKHYGLNQYFSEMYFYEDYSHNKYDFLIEKGYKTDSIVFFENEKRSVKEAIKCALNKSNIIKIKF